MCTGFWDSDIPGLVLLDKDIGALLWLILL